MADPNQNLDVDALLQSMDELAASGAKLSSTFIELRKKLTDEQKSVSESAKSFDDINKRLDAHKDKIDKSYKALNEHLILGAQQEKLNKEQLKDAKQYVDSLKQYQVYLKRQMSLVDKNSEAYEVLNKKHEIAKNDIDLVNKARQNSLSGLNRAQLSFERFKNLDLGKVGQDLKNSFIGLTSATTSFGKGLLAGGTKPDAIGHTTQLLGSATKSLGDAIKNIPLIGGILNVASKGLTFAMDVLGQEAKKVFNNFENITRAGGLFTNGMTGMSNAAHNAGLNLDQFGSLVKESAAALALIGGTVSSGTLRFSKVSAELDANGGKLRERLLKLGYDYQDQAEGLTDFMASLQATGNLRGMADRRVAEQATDYLTVLREITSITGEDAKQAKQRIQEADRQAAVQARLQELGGNALQKYNALVAAAGPRFQKAIEQMFLTGGKVVEPSLAVLFAQVPALRDVFAQSVQDISNNNVSLDRAQTSFRDNLHQSARQIRDQGLAASNSLGLVASVSGKYADTAAGASEVVRLGTQAMTDSFTSAGKVAEKQATTGDTLTSSIIEMHKSFQSMSVQLERFIQTNAYLLPMYVKTQEQLLAGIQKLIGGIGGAAAAADSATSSWGSIALKAASIATGGIIGGDNNILGTQTTGSWIADATDWMFGGHSAQVANMLAGKGQGPTVTGKIKPAPSTVPSTAMPKISSPIGPVVSTPEAPGNTTVDMGDSNALVRAQNNKLDKLIDLMQRSVTIQNKIADHTQ